MANKTVTVKTSDGTYTSLQAAITGELSANADLTAGGLNGILTIECYALNDAITAPITIDGFTTDATHYLKITAPSGERHGGTYTTDKYRLTTSTNNVRMLNVQDAYVWIDGLQVRNASAYPEHVIQVDAGSPGSSRVRFTDCLVQVGADGARTITVTSGTVEINQCTLIENSTGQSNFVIANGAVAYLYQSDVVGGSYGVYHEGSAANVVIKNSYIGGTGTSDVYSANYTFTTSACEDDITATGLTKLIAYATSSGARFSNVSSGSENFALASASALKDAGTDISADAHWSLGSTDIAGTARGGTWDIGPFEYGAASAYEGSATLGIGAGVTSSGGASTNYQGSAALAVGAGVEAARLGTAAFPEGRIVTADAIRLLTAPTDIWGGTDDPDPAEGAIGDAFFKGAGGLFVKTADGWVNYTPMWKRTGTLLEPLTAGDSLAVPGTLGVTGIGTFGSHVNPLTGYVSNLGALTKKYLALHAAELWVETLVAQNTLATIGGRILVGPTNPLTADLAAAGTTITVKYNHFASGDRVYLEANGNAEWMAITSAAGGSAGAYTYSVTRNLDGSGANDWAAGDAVFSTGTTGAGYIDLYSTRSLRSASHKGPTIVGNVRTGTTYSDLVERWAVGNLDGLYGYSGATYGAAFGDPAKAWVKIDSTNGVRLGYNTTTHVEIDASGNAKFISIAALAAVLGSGGYLRQGQTAYNTGTGFWLGDDSGTPKFSIGDGSTNFLTWDGSVLKASAASLDLSAMPFCRVSRITSDTSAIAFDSHIHIPFNNEVADTFGMHDNSTNPSRVTVPTAGLYLIDLSAALYEPSNVGNEIAFIAIRVNDTTSYGYTSLRIDWNNNFINMHTSAVLQLAASDYVEAIAGTQNGPNPGTMTVTYQGDTSMTVTKIH